MSIETLLAYEDRWVTRMGAWFSGDKVIFRGKDLHRELMDLPWFELYVYSITGKRFDSNEMRVLNSIWTSTSYPDPRIWNNRVAAIGGTARTSPTLALSAAMAVSEARIYGHQANVHAIDFITRAKQRVDEGVSLQELVECELKQRRMIGGFGRPLYRKDERIEHMMRVARETGRDQGAHVALAFEIEKILLTGRWRLHMNITGLDAAFGADLGLSVKEYHLLVVPAFLAGMPPCFIDTQSHPEGVFFPMRCDRIEKDEIHVRRNYQVDTNSS